MTTPSKTRVVHDIALRILAGVRERLAESWDDLDPADRELVIACCNDAAVLQLRALAAGRPAG